MGAELFPAALYARISPDDYEAEPEFSVTRQKAADLSEFRLYNGTAWRCTFVLITRTLAERNTLRSFRDARLGAWDSFWFTAPDDGIQRHVIFDEFTGTKVGPTAYRYQIALLEAIS